MVFGGSRNLLPEMGFSGSSGNGTGPGAVVGFSLYPSACLMTCGVEIANMGVCLCYLLAPFPFPLLFRLHFVAFSLYHCHRRFTLFSPFPPFSYISSRNHLRFSDTASSPSRYCLVIHALGVALFWGWKRGGYAHGKKQITCQPTNKTFFVIKIS
ncbi:hypothetical protein HOY80DRAFT_279962 [Tuber brumale]|nr:hypothetical protein HOY80DRAFT_279962 [Tuber brumale]